MRTSIKTLLVAAGLTAGIAAAGVYANWSGPGACPQGQAMGYGGPGMGPGGMGPGMGFGPQGMGPGHGPGMGRGPHGMGMGGPGFGSEMRIEHMTEELGLSAEQRDKLRAVVDKNRPQMRALHDQMTDNRKQLQALMQQGGAKDADLRKVADAQGKLIADMIVQRHKLRGEIAAVLTPEQREVFQNRFQHRGPYRGAEAGGAEGATSGT
jgi:protein CpxP